MGHNKVYKVRVTDELDRVETRPVETPACRRAWAGAERSG